MILRMENLLSDVSNNNNDLYSANSIQCSNALYNKITQSKNRIRYLMRCLSASAEGS